MSDTYYGLECLVRERTRAIDKEVQHRLFLAQARGRHRPPSLERRARDIIEGLMRLRRFRATRTETAAERWGLGGLPALIQPVHGRQATIRRRMISVFICGVRSLK